MAESKNTPDARRGVALPSDISPEVKKLARDLFGLLNDTDIEAEQKVTALVLVIAREIADMADSAHRSKIIDDVGECVGMPLSELVVANEAGAETLEDDGEDMGEAPE